MQYLIQCFPLNFSYHYQGILTQTCPWTVHLRLIKWRILILLHFRLLYRNMILIPSLLVCLVNLWLKYSRSCCFSVYGSGLSRLSIGSPRFSSLSLSRSIRTSLSLNRSIWTNLSLSRSGWTSLSLICPWRISLPIGCPRLNNWAWTWSTLLSWWSLVDQLSFTGYILLSYLYLTCLRLKRSWLGRLTFNIPIIDARSFSWSSVDSWLFCSSQIHQWSFCCYRSGSV